MPLQCRIERNRDCPQFGERKPGLQEFRTVEKEQKDMVPLLNPECSKVPGDGVRGFM